MRVGTKLRLRQDGWDETTRIPAGTIGTVLDVYATGGVYIEFSLDDCTYGWNDIEPHEIDALFEEATTTKLEAFRAGEEFHFILGDADGYGWCDIDQETGEFVSGGFDRSANGSQEHRDAIAAAIDALTDDEFAALCVNAPDERAGGAR